MPHYLHQIAYTSDSWKSLVAQPQNRVEVVRQAIEKLGGKVVAGFMAFGEYDVVVITEMPDQISAAAIAIAVRLRWCMQICTYYTVAFAGRSPAGDEESVRIRIPSGLTRCLDS